ncbi:MAG: rhomboid family intramembrane serine protease [Ilumatobacteraceae bacterium]
MSIPQPPTLTHCYRHPNRETGRHCTRCGKPACSECLVQAQVGSHCVDCAKAARPDVKTRIKYANAKQPALITNAIIAINVAVFLWVAAGDFKTLTSGFGGGGGVSNRQVDLGLNRQILHYGIDGAGRLGNGDNEWYRLVTSGFLHFGILHIALNMYLLYLLGQLLERELGRTRFALLYMASLLGGSAGVLLFTDIGISGGASGAVFGLMGAAAISMHRQGINIFQTGIGRTLVLNLVITFVLGSSLGISIGGHIGGVIAGAVCGVVMMAPKWKPFPKWATYAAPVAVSVLAVVISVVRVG